MIIASIRHTQLLSNYGVNYIFDGISDEPEHQWLIFQNISRGFTRKDIIDSFNDNARYLTKNPKRKRIYRTWKNHKNDKLSGTERDTRFTEASRKNASAQHP